MSTSAPSQDPLRILLAINGTDFGGTESALAEIALTFAVLAADSDSARPDMPEAWASR